MLTMEVAVSDFRGVRERDLVRVMTSPFTCCNGALEENSRLIGTLPSTRHPTPYVVVVLLRLERDGRLSSPPVVVSRGPRRVIN